MNKAEQRHPGGRPREGKYLTCLDCSQHFYVNQKSRRKYCSDKCARDSVKKRVFDPERGLKKCAMCNEWKSTDSFQEANRRVGGHGKQAYCRPCSLIKSNEWSSKNPETKRTHRKTAYYKNPEYYREARRNLSKEEREKKNKYSAKYRAENPDKVRLWNKARIHTLRAAGKITREMMLRLIALQKNRCAVCKITFDKAKSHLDHITPISLGGTNEFTNLQYLCASCNLRKHARDPLEFMRSRGFLL